MAAGPASPSEIPKSFFLMGEVVLPQIGGPKMATISLRGLKGKMPGRGKTQTITVDKTCSFLTNWPQTRLDRHRGLVRFESHRPGEEPLDHEGKNTGHSSRRPRRCDP